MKARIVAGFVAAAAGGARAQPAKLEALVAQLGGTSCPSLSGLEPLFGPQHHSVKDDAEAMLSFDLTIANGKQLGIRRAIVTPRIDFYHVAPSSVKDPTVGELQLDLDDHVKIDGLVGSIAGATHYAVATDTVWHAGNIYASTSAHRLVLICGAQRPAWAQQPWTADSARDATTRVLAAIEGKPTNTSRDERYELDVVGGVHAVFETPLPAAPLLAALGATKVVLHPVDVHRSHWVLRHADARQTPIVYAGNIVEITVVEDGIDKLDKKTPLDASKLKMTSLAAERR